MDVNDLLPEKHEFSMEVIDVWIIMYENTEHQE
jgi:hypothetical protein